MAQKNLVVKRVTFRKCMVCQGAEVTHYIAYRDREKEVERTPDGVYLPLYGEFACDLHVTQVALDVLKQAGFPARQPGDF